MNWRVKRAVSLTEIVEVGGVGTAVPVTEGVAVEVVEA